MMAKESINEVSAYTLAGLITDLMQKFRNGVRTLQDITWFLNLSQKDLADFQGRKISATLNKLFKELTTLFEKVSPNNNYIDNDIINWFDSDKVNSESSEFKGKTSVIRFKKDISHGDIIESDKKAGRYQEFTLLEGLAKAKELVENGEVEERGKGIIIYLSTRDKDGGFCGLCVYRNFDGWLKLSVNEVRLVSVWGVSYSVLSRNKRP